LQSAPRQTANEGPATTEVVIEQPVARKRRIKPATYGVIGVVALLALVPMIANMIGLWPPKSGPFEPTLEVPTPYAAGLLVEKAGPHRIEGDQVIVPVKVTNQVHISAAVQGTPTPNAPTPTAEPANVINGIVRVLFYDKDKRLLGHGIGNVTNLPFGQSKTIEVVAIGIPQFDHYEVEAEGAWTDKDPVKATTVPSP
jgi:hypothetical protein